MSEINEELTKLLKGKVVKKIYVTAFPDIRVEFEDGTMLQYIVQTITKNVTNGDERGIITYIDNNMIGKFMGKYDEITGFWVEIKEK